MAVGDVAGKSDAKVFKSCHMSSAHRVVKSKPVHLGMLETNKEQVLVAVVVIRTAHKERRSHPKPMIEENRQLVTNEQVEFEK